MKKGFTLIELLAVILILGVIALIAIPQVTNIIEEAQIGAIRRSAEQYIKSVETYVTTEEMKGTIITGNVSVEELTPDLNLKGTLPVSGNITVSNGEITECSILYEKYYYNCDGTLAKTNNYDIELVEDNNSNNQMDTGDKICIDTECFYVISNNNGTVRALAEWNLNVGYDATKNGSDIFSPVGYVDTIYEGEEEREIFQSHGATYTKLAPDEIKQDKTKFGIIWDEFGGIKGVIEFYAMPKSSGCGSYWVDDECNLIYPYTLTGDLPEPYEDTWDFPYPYVYDENSVLFPYINSYVESLKIKTGFYIKAELLKYTELEELGCVLSLDDCSSAPVWLKNTSFWLGTAYSDKHVYNLASYGIGIDYSGGRDVGGIRPVIEFNI